MDDAAVLRDGVLDCDRRRQIAMQVGKVATMVRFGVVCSDLAVEGIGPPK